MFFAAKLAAPKVVKKEPEEDDPMEWGDGWTSGPVERNAKADEEAQKKRGEEQSPKEELLDPEENWDVVYDEKEKKIVPRQGGKPGQRFTWYNPKENMTKKLGQVFS